MTLNNYPVDVICLSLSPLNRAHHVSRLQGRTQCTGCTTLNQRTALDSTVLQLSYAKCLAAQWIPGHHYHLYHSSAFRSPPPSQNLTLIAVYAPNNAADNATNDGVYGSVQNLTSSTPRCDFLFVARDWDTHTDLPDESARHILLGVWDGVALRERVLTGELLRHGQIGCLRHPESNY